MFSNYSVFLWSNLNPSEVCSYAGLYKYKYIEVEICRWKYRGGNIEVEIVYR